MKQPSLQIPVVILVGGLGTRLRPVVPNTPKPLALVAGQPFLGRLIAQATTAGASEIILCAGYEASAVEEFVADHKFDVPVRISQETKPLGTAGPARLAMDLFAAPTFVLMNGDSYADVDLGAMLEAHLERQALATMAVADVPDVARYGSVTVTTDLQVAAFHEKSPAGGAGFINAGVYLLDRTVMAGLSPGAPASIEQDVLPRLAGEGLYAFPIAGAFIDIGTPEDFVRAQTFFAAC